MQWGHRGDETLATHLSTFRVPFGFLDSVHDGSPPSVRREGAEVFRGKRTGLRLLALLETSLCLALTHPSPGSLAAGARAAPSVLRGFHQPGLLRLQLLLRVAELQARGAQKGLQGGEAPGPEGREGRGGGRPVFWGQLESPALTRATPPACSPPLGQRVCCGEGQCPRGEPGQPHPACPSRTDVCVCVCVCV